MYLWPRKAGSESTVNNAMVIKDCYSNAQPAGLEKE